MKWEIWKSGVMLNEGAGPVNFTILFPWSVTGFFIYVYWFGKRWFWPKRKMKFPFAVSRRGH